MDTYASLSLNSINYFSPANVHVFPKLCGPLGITDADAYCATKTSEVCCGLCPNQSVNGPGQFVWAIVSYGIAAFTYTLAPSEVWGVAVMQMVNANAFIGVGLIRVVLGASAGGMTRYHTQFLWPQALGFIYIMAPAIFAPHWSRVGKSQKDMEVRVFERTQQMPHEARRSDVRELEQRLYKRYHDYWSYPIFAFWIINMSLWTALYVWVSVANIEFSQSNCENVIEYILSPNVATIILGILAWLLVAFDGFLHLHKEKQGGSDYIIDTFLSKGKNRSMKEHRRLERKITIGVTLVLFVLWLVLNCWLWFEGLYKFYLSGADWMTFGQVEQLTALFPDLLALAAGISGYLGTRDDLQLSRSEVKRFVAQRKSRQAASKSAGEASGDDDVRTSRRSALRRGLTHLHTRSRSGRTGPPAQHRPPSDDEASHAASDAEDVPPSHRSSHISPLDPTARRHSRYDDDEPPSPRSFEHASLAAMRPRSRGSSAVEPGALPRALATHSRSPSFSGDDEFGDYGHEHEHGHERGHARGQDEHESSQLWRSSSTTSHADNQAHHAPYGGLPRPERASLVTLRDHFGMPSSVHGNVAHAHATAHDEPVVEASLASRSSSRRRRTRGRLAGMLAEEEPLREKREWE